ncbi:O-antigen ligase family protein [Marivita sp. S2033]|uniref:O-antigen ligase family protein n=1 Tax=Marivita sp. S2033 TaxID=3373187 RepID=UPI003981F0C6
MPNALATLILAAWPLVTAALFLKLPPGRAVIAALLVGYLFLPEPPAGFDFPLIPPLQKHTIPALSAFVMWFLLYGHEGNFLPRSPVVNLLLFVFIASPIATTLLNSEAIHWGVFHIQAMVPKDALGLVIQQVLLVIPFLLARRFLWRAEDQRDLMYAFMIGGLLYSLPMLLEIRLSPQLNLWVYGYYQHDFIQTIRFGGFRPTVFLYHGIWVAFFMLMAVLSAFALWKTKQRRANWKLLFIALYLTGVLVLAKSLGAWLFAAVLIPSVVLLNARWQMRLAVLIVSFAIAYPALKGINVLPQDRILYAVEKIDPDRAASLAFRFGNENQLLERAHEKPLFGWGNYNRNQIIDSASGEVETVTDGRWVLLIGQFGWLGFLAEFGLLVLPVFFVWRETRYRTPDGYSALIVPLSLILAVNVFDMLPNATLTPLTWMMAGASTGYAESLRHSRDAYKSAQRLQWRPVL